MSFARTDRQKALQLEEGRKEKKKEKGGGKKKKGQSLGLAVHVVLLTSTLFFR